jgi:hypothetical protein
LHNIRVKAAHPSEVIMLEVVGNSLSLLLLTIALAKEIITSSLMRL